MPEKRYDLREIARAALGDMPPNARADLLTEMLVEISGDDALHLMAHARNIVTLRIEQLVDERYPLHDLTEAHGDIAAIRVRSSAISLAASGASLSDASVPDQRISSKPWANVRSQADAEAFLAEASAEDIDLTASDLLEGLPVPIEWRSAQAHLTSALSSSARLVRRVISARGEVRPAKYRFRSREDGRGTQS